MPIIEIEIVTMPDEAIRSDIPKRLADSIGKVLAAPPGHTWVRLHRLPSNDYAESGTDAEKLFPVFVSILRKQMPDQSILRKEAIALTESIAKICNRPKENVHIHFLPEAKSRISFGGNLRE